MTLIVRVRININSTSVNADSLQNLLTAELDISSELEDLTVQELCGLVLAVRDGRNDGSVIRKSALVGESALVRRGSNSMA